MTRSKFRENSLVQRQTALLHTAIMRLSLAGYGVKHFRSGDSPSIEIDRPFAGEPHRVTQHAEKRFGHCQAHGCRVYWQIAQGAAEAA